MKKVRYLDNASTTKINDEVLKEMIPYFDHYYFNASSNYKESVDVKGAIEKSRKLCAEIIKAETHEIVFTSGATESINYALKGFVEENFEKGNHIITCKSEHKALLKTCEYLETKGVEVTYLNVDKGGLIDLNELENSITTDTSLIAIMIVNNETGVMQDIHAIGSIAKRRNLTFFCDATQAVGKVDIDVDHFNIDLLCMSAHKINGPKGVGFLYVRDGIKLTPLIHGGGQESNNRGGTYNTPLIVGLGKACQVANSSFLVNHCHYRNLFNKVIDAIHEMDKVSLIGDRDSRIYNVLNIRIEDLDASVFVESPNGFAVSNGSACSSRIIEGSHVLRAMGLSERESNQCLRISFDGDTSIDDIDQFLKTIRSNA